MKIKETPWERRNLGVRSSVEYYLGQDDSEESIGEDVLHNTSYSYQVAHIPVGRIDVLNIMLQNGFQFSETKVEITADLKNLTAPKMYEHYCEKMSYHQADTGEAQKIYHAMERGVFETDKVSLDPYFDAHVAGRRYAYWTQDEIKAGQTFLYVVERMNEGIGFFALKKVSERMGESFLAGLFDRNMDFGLGFSVLYFPLVEAKRMGLRKVVSGVSSNNPDSLKMHLALGYQIKSMHYTLVKHVKKPED